MMTILGNVLLSHAGASAVPSGLKGLTSVFGMGTGVSPSLQSPKKSFRISTGSRALPHSVPRMNSMVKPNGPLVTVSSTGCPASTSVLSNW